jgi:putative transposase
VHRLMQDLGIIGVVRGERTRTTLPADVAARPNDLVDRQILRPRAEPAPGGRSDPRRQLVRVAYSAFIIDAFSRRILGWCVAATLRAELALDASRRPFGRVLATTSPA